MQNDEATTWRAARYSPSNKLKHLNRTKRYECGVWGSNARTAHAPVNLREVKLPQTDVAVSGRERKRRKGRGSRPIVHGYALCALGDRFQRTCNNQVTLDALS